MRLALATSLLALATTAGAQTVTNLKNQAPDGAALTFLLTDGTVMAQGGNQNDWWKLTPDQNGNYQAGTWSKLATLPAGYVPDAFASAVLADGRLLIEGGEYNQGSFAFTDMGAIYDPIANTWKMVPPPKGWGFIGDSPATVLADGRFLLGRKFDTRIAVLDPKTLTWTELAHTGKQDFDAEEGWTLLPDGSVLTFDVKNAPNSERYYPAQQKWVSQGSTITNLMSPPVVGSIHYGKNHVYHPPGEVGPAILRPDGTVFATGGIHKGATTAGTAIWHPGNPGHWTAGPFFTNGDSASDSFAALLPSGNVLVEANSGGLYEFDGTKLIATRFSAQSSLLVLPTGQVLIGGYALYTPAGQPQSGWAPTITSVPSTLARGTTVQLAGTQLNGLSQAAAFGDEFQTATNYPIVALRNNTTHHVIYARTHDHSSMGVATGNQTVTTQVDIPKNAETGATTLTVIANGIPSSPVAVTVQ